MRSLCTVHLHGRLSEFGETHRLCVSSPLDAYRALAAQLQGFAEAFREGAYRLIRGENLDSGVEYSEAALSFPVGPDGAHFHFVPVVAGAKSGGGKVILGAVIAAAAVAGATFTGGSSLYTTASGVKILGSTAGTLGSLGAGMGATAVLGVTWGGVALFGGMLMVAGIAQMMQPGVKTDYNESAEQKASFFLGGQVNQAVQGGPVVLAYGRCRVGSTVISAGLASERM